MKNQQTYITTIIPRLPPATDGVGDYALNLARQLRKDFNIHTHFIVGCDTWTGDAEIEEFPVTKVSDRSPAALLTLLSGNDDKLPPNSPILLHYVGYGYATRGCPVWLIDGLQSWKNLYPHRSLVTMFHEISASGPIWTSAFWLSHLQRNLATRLTKMSDRCITTKQLYADIITNISKGKHSQVSCLPVFSNIGEPDKLPLDLSERQPRLVVFGGTANRKRVYQQSQKLLDDICRKLNIQEIWDIGDPTGITPACIGKTPVIEMGKQPAEQIGDIFAESLVGFSDYHPDFFAKSTIFAAYCAYRLLPINAQGSLLAIDGIQSGKHYLAPNIEESINENEMQSIASNAYLWYQNHNLVDQTKTYAALLFGSL
jgi:hypothetical protein